LCSCLILTGLPICHLLYFVLVLPAIWCLMMLPAGYRISPRVQYFVQGLAIVCYFVLAYPLPVTTPIPESGKTGVARLLMVVPLAIALALAYGIVLFMKSSAQVRVPEAEIRSREAAVVPT